MRINSIKINNLRNISDAEIAPCSHLNLLVGDNGAGKTTVLEAIVVLAKGRSFRSGQIASLIGPQEPHFMVTAELAGGDRKRTRLGFWRSGDQWRARRNGEECQNIGELAADLPLVLLEPNSHALVSGPPDGRRRYMDWSVFHVEHKYLTVWRRYSRAIKQRNAALRARNRRLATSLDPQMAELGEWIDARRARRAEEIADTVPRTLDALGSRLPPVVFNYQRGWAGESLREALSAAVDRDMERGATGPGPHRADLSIRCGDLPARDSLSRGEQKLVAASLLLAQAEAIRTVGERPIFLLDDLASEFDDEHRSAVLEACLGLDAQTWVTGTSRLPAADLALAEHRVFHVEQGAVR